MSGRFEEIVTQLLGAVGSATGRDYLERFVTRLAALFAADCAFVARIDPNDPARLELLAVHGDDNLRNHRTWPLQASACGEIIAGNAACVFRTRVTEKFPADGLLQQTGARALAGVPLFSPGGERLGLVALLDRAGIDDDLFAVDVMQLFAGCLTAGARQLGAKPEPLPRQPAADDSRCREELEALRHELETLSHSVSHDLRGPLRAIDGFSEFLVTDYADRLDETAQDYLARIRRNVRQMDELLQALLILSRVTRHPLAPAGVDLSRLCTTAAEQLQRRGAPRKVSFSIQPDLLTCCDVKLMTIALEQLLDNAWKFTGQTASAHIRVFADRRDDELVFCVADNGAGFDMAYADKLFDLFQRLHCQQSYPGLGAGLTIVKRIIERHGGRIWARSNTDAGASFCFTLPQAPVASGGHPAVNSPT